MTEKRLQVNTTKSREQRWREEAEFFDVVAEQSTAEALDSVTLARYRTDRLRRRFSKEFRFQLFGGLSGKTILDVGCGDGANAVLFAMYGANVTGVDVSPRAIEIAERRAAINAVTESVHFICAPLESAEIAPESFDIIWCNKFLHHAIAELDLIMGKLAEWAKPGALMVFSEPTNFNQMLRRIRLEIPVGDEISPNERPLELPEMDLIGRYLVNLNIRPYNLIGRLNRWILVNTNYERSPLFRRGVANLFCTLDYLLLSLPFLNRMGGEAVIWGQPRKGPASGNSVSATKTIQKGA